MNCNTVILGGGVAGWLTALVIKKSKPGMNITVCLLYTSDAADE